MKKTATALFSLLLAISALNAQGQTKTYDISGTVVDSLSSEPLPGVYVTAGSKGGQTNGDGHYVIKNVPAGKVTLKTMYYSSYPTATREIELTGDTTVDFILAEQIFNINEVVVTGTRTEKRLAEAPVLTTVIGEREIEKAGSVSMLESLQDNIPGIVISPNAMGNNMCIKGLNSRYILMLVDGERLVSEGAGGNVNLDQIDVNNIERIEMINGAASALYGSNAVGAVINVITKKPVHKFEADANASWANHNTWRTRLSAGTNLKKFSARASGFRNSSDGFGGDGEGAYAAAYEDYGATLNMGYRPTDRSDVNVVGRFFSHETFNPTGSMNASHALSHNLSLGANGGLSSADKRNSMRLSVNFDKYFDYEVLEKKNDTKNKDNTSSYISARFIDTFIPTAKWELIGGLEYNHEENFATSTLGATPTTKTLDDANVFAQAEYEILKNFDAVAGARYTYNSQFGSAFTPKLSLMYEVAEWRFRGGVGTAFRAPSIKELYYDFDHQGMFWVYGNPDLKAEKGLYSSLSAEYTEGLLNVSVSAYYNNINNKITQYDVINAAGGNEKYYKNVSSATLRGIDVTFSYLFSKHLAVRANYSFCDAVDNSTGLQLEDNVKHSGTVSLTWNGRIARSPFSLQIAGRMNSPKLYQQIITGSDGSQTVSMEESDPYSIWKIVLVKPFRINKHTIEVTFKVDNLFNFREASFVDPGRQFLIGIRYAFK